jgi:hypothetical protein
VSDDETNRDDETDEGQDAQGTEPGSVDTADLDDDPAYNPDDEDLKGIKGG